MLTNERERKAKYRSAARVVLCPDLPVVRLDDRTRDRQSKSCALFLGRVKRTEDLVELVLRDAWPGVTYRYFDA